VAVAGLALAAGPVLPAAGAPTTSDPSSSATHSATARQPSAKKATFGIEPATNGKPDGRAFLQYGATPYATFSDHVAIVNFSAKSYTFELYTTDVINDNTGSLALLPIGKRPTGAGSWIKLGDAATAGKLTVRPRSSVVVPIEGKVPGNASPGDHVGAVVIDLATRGKRGNLNVLLHQRIGLRTFIRVAGDAKPGLAIEDLSTRHHNNWSPIGAGNATVSYRIHNTGNLVVSTTQKVTVSGLLGETASAQPKAIPLLLPGGTADITVPMSGVLPEVWMNAKVLLTPQVVNNAGETAIGIKPTSATEHFWAIPWVFIAIVIGLIGLLGGFWRWRRKLRRAAGRHNRAKDSESGRNGKRSSKPGEKQEVST
jgi:hypothetical protein